MSIRYVICRINEAKSVLPDEKEKLVRTEQGFCGAAGCRARKAYRINNNEVVRDGWQEREVETGEDGVVFSCGPERVKR